LALAGREAAEVWVTEHAGAAAGRSVIGVMGACA
jgi:hypothetical protein